MSEGQSLYLLCDIGWAGEYIPGLCYFQQKSCQIQHLYVFKLDKLYNIQINFVKRGTTYGTKDSK